MIHLQQMMAVVGFGVMAFLLPFQLMRVIGRLTVFSCKEYDIAFGCSAALIAQYFIIR